MFTTTPSSTVRKGIGLLLAVALSTFIVGSPPGSPAEAARPLTTVSLTFDDGNANQMAAATILANYQVKGTFFITSGFLNAPGYLTTANLNTLKANGQEIGGHSLSHPDLTNVPADEAKRQICNDRVALLGLGHAVRSFAYPFASLSPAVKTIAADCGYNSARALGDLAFPLDPDCSGCPSAATLPPADPYETAALPQVESSWTLADLKGAVTRAEVTGGWVQFTFHNVCAASAGCELNVTPTVLQQFTQWLVLRKVLRNTVIKTVGDTIGGAVKPGVNGPPVTPPDPGANAVVNPGMETLNPDGSPQCWMKGGYGTNTSVLDLKTPGRTGSRAGRATMSGYVDGDAKWLQQFDLGGCSPTVVPGHTYSLRQWYTATGVTQFAVYLRDAGGVWHYWTSSPWFASATEFTQANWTTPEIPAGMTGLSFGLNIFGNGTLVTDDTEMYDSVGAPAARAAAVPTPKSAPSISSRIEIPTDTH